MPVNMKDIIEETFKKMAQKKSLDKITVKDLVEECQISRQTFYYHFCDIMEVIEWSLQKGVEKMMEESRRAKDPEDALKIFITSAVENGKSIDRLLDSQKREEIEKMIVRAIRSYIEKMVKEYKREVSLSYDDLQVTLDFYSYGIVGLLLENCRKPGVDPERLAHQMALLLTGNMVKEKE